MKMQTRASLTGRKISRRALLKATGVGAVGMALAACAPPAAPAAAPAAPAAPAKSADATALPAAASAGGEPVTLRLWHWDNFMLEPWEKEFGVYKQTHPNVTVKFENTPYDEFSQKMGAAIAGVTPLDITVTAGAHVTNLTAKEQLKNLE